MSPEHVALIRASFARIAPRASAVGEAFYARLFRSHPELRPLFRQEPGAQSRKFAAMLGMIVAALDQPQRLQAMLCALGERHAGYGVRTAHYDGVAVALLQTLREELGADFDAGLEAAWSAAYGFMATRMVAASCGARSAA